MTLQRSFHEQVKAAGIRHQCVGDRRPLLLVLTEGHALGVALLNGGGCLFGLRAAA
jgi:hypothetical protein